MRGVGVIRESKPQHRLDLILRAVGSWQRVLRGGTAYVDIQFN